MDTKNSIIEACVKSLYGGKNSARTIKNQNPGSMIREIQNSPVQIVGLYSKLPKHISSIINDKSAIKARTDSKFMKELAQFILKHEEICSKKPEKGWCCFLDDPHKEFLSELSKEREVSLSQLKRFYKPRDWFYKSERQIYSKAN